jgi:hypothetical protein
MLPTDATDLRAGIISTLPGMAARLMNLVPINRVAPMCVLQGQCQALPIVRSNDQMHVIRHQAIAHQPHSMEFDVLAQKIEIHHAVGVAIQDKSPRIPTLGYVVRNIHGNDSSQRATMRT